MPIVFRYLEMLEMLEMPTSYGPSEHVIVATVHSGLYNLESLGNHSVEPTEGIGREAKF